MSLNKVFLVGRLTKDVELKYMPSGDAVARFTLATNYKVKEKETSEFTNIVVIGRQAENCGAFLKKGSSCSVHGKIEYRTYENKEGKKTTVTEVMAKEIDFIND